MQGLLQIRLQGLSVGTDYTIMSASFMPLLLAGAASHTCKY